MIESWHDGMIKNNIVPFYAFDGAKHSMKSTAHANRSNNRKRLKLSWIHFMNVGKTLVWMCLMKNAIKI